MTGCIPRFLMIKLGLCCIGSRYFLCEIAFLGFWFVFILSSKSPRKRFRGLECVEEGLLGADLAECVEFGIGHFNQVDFSWLRG